MIVDCYQGAKQSPWSTTVHIGLRTCNGAFVGVVISENLRKKCFFPNETKRARLYRSLSLRSSISNYT